MCLQLYCPQDDIEVTNKPPMLQCTLLLLLLPNLPTIWLPAG
jgi:hypothetical protein